MEEGGICLWDLREAAATACLSERGFDGVRAVALDGHMLISAPSPGPLVSAWDLRAPRAPLERLRGHTNNDALAVDARSGRVACGGRMNELRVWETCNL